MRRSRTGPIALGLLAVPWALAAQAPRITPAGDPSVRSDSIYALAVDPADYPGQSAIYLLDDGVVEVQADGRERRTFRQVVQILQEDAVESFAEHQFGWSPDDEEFTLNWIRVVRPDGTVVSGEPAIRQESEVPAAMGAPVYANRKVLRVSMSGVAVGTIVDYSATTVKTRAWMPGDFYQGWSVNTARSVRRSRFILDAPASERVRIRERNLDFPRRTVHANGRQVLTWATSDVPVIRPEPYAADSNDVYMSVTVSSPETWNDIGRWYAGLADGRYALSPALTDSVRRLVRGAATARDTAAAVQRWVAQDIRYVSVALGIGGYQPRAPAEVVASGFGDCKDKATLFVAAMRTLGYGAATVLTSSTGGVERGLPSIEQFDHAIAYVDLPEGREYTDLTTPILPLGVLPFGLQGEFGLAVPNAGEVAELTFPEEPASARVSLTEFTGVVDTAGRANGWLRISLTGSRQATLRSAFEAPMDSAKRADFARSLAQGVFPGARADSLVGFDGLDLSVPAEIAVRVSGGRAVRRSGDGWMLANPLGTREGYLDEADRLAGEPPRRLPVDAGAVLGPEEDVVHVRLTIPGGWAPHLPATVRATSEFGVYEARYDFADGVLDVTQRTSGSRGIYPPSSITSLIDWLRAVGQDDSPYILLERVGGP